jgi:hypothetical protein
VMNRDPLTTLLRTFMALVAAQEKTRLAIGIILGLALESLRVGYIGSNYDVGQGGFWVSFPSFGSLAFGMIIVFIPILFQRPKVTEDERAILATIEDLIEKGELSPSEKRLAYRRILQKYVDASGPQYAGKNKIDLSSILEGEKE